MFLSNYISTSTCIPVKGFNRGIILDLPREKYDYIPNSLVDFLKLVNTKEIEDIFSETPLEYASIIKEYIEFCIFNEYILKIPKEIDKKLFPKLNLNHFLPNIISNFYIEIDKQTQYTLAQIATLLEYLKCYDFQIILKEDYDLAQLEKNLNELSWIGLRSIEIISKFNESYKFENLFINHKNISFIYLYEAPETKILKENYCGIQQIFCSKNKLGFSYKKHIEEFNVNITLFTEAQSYNTYFNKKLFIDHKGNIKNSYETSEIFGNLNYISKDKIIEIINSDKFQKYWSITKDKIDVCKDCEYRYICVDNRVPVKRSDKEWFMETECNYNPYIAKWESEDDYKKLNECGVVSDKNGFKIDPKKLEIINKEIWGE